MDLITVFVNLIAHTSTVAIVEYNEAHYLVELGLLEHYQDDIYIIEAALLGPDTIIAYRDVKE